MAATAWGMMQPLCTTRPKFLQWVDHNFPLFCLLILFVIHACQFITWPIEAGDTDLWYHLDSGRYMVTHHAIPHESYFSFIRPTRVWSNYYWLFQLIVYQIYSWWGYLGLVLFRASMYLLTMGIVAAYLLRGSRVYQRFFYPVVLAGFYFIVLISRCLLVRPHLITYALIAIFLYILEFQPKRWKYLPFLGIFWVNVHGIAYPVMCLITGSYVIEYLWHRARNTAIAAGAATRSLVPLMLTLATVYVTPHGLRLLRVPFTPISYTARFIQEFRPVSLQELASIHVGALTPSYDTVLSVLLLLAGVALLVSLVRSQRRLSHALICVGGFFLLTRGVRFFVECSLLAMPVLAFNSLFASTPTTRLALPKAERFIGGMLAGFLIIMPVQLSGAFFAGRPTYPFSSRNLPRGICAFLNHVQATGSVLNPPNPGGYMRWVLYPHYKIFMDLEVPFLFTAEDFYLAAAVFNDEAALGRVVRRYQPLFIAVPIDEKKFVQHIQAFPEYRLVFFDDTEVLYLDERQQPALARRYALDGVDPYELAAGDREAFMAEGKQSALLKHLAALVSIEPEGVLTNEMLVRGYNKDGTYDRALVFARILIRLHPELPVGYLLQGDALRGLRLPEQALACYQLSLARSEGSATMAVYKRMGQVQFEQHDYRKAYEAFQRSMDVFAADASPEDLYSLGVAALRAGKRDEAKSVLTLLYYYRVVDADPHWLKRMTQTLARWGIALDEAR